MTRKETVIKIVTEKGLYSCMNNTKWRELKKGVSELLFEPPFTIKAIDEDEAIWHHLTADSSNGHDWGLYMDNYLGGDIYATPFYAVEYIKVRPRLAKSVGRLVSRPEIIDETPEFISILEKYNIPFEELNGTYTIYGYRMA